MNPLFIIIGAFTLVVICLILWMIICRIREYINLKSLLIIFTFLIFAFPAAAWWPFGPSNCNDCILKYMKNTQSKTAVRMIRKACNDKFYKPVKIRPKKQTHPIYGERPDFESWKQEITESKMWSKKMCNCILDNMPGVENDRAAWLIFNSCKEKIVKWRYSPQQYLLPIYPTHKENKQEGKQRLIKKNGKYYFIEDNRDE